MTNGIRDDEQVAEDIARGKRLRDAYAVLREEVDRLREWEVARLNDDGVGEAVEHRAKGSLYLDAMKALYSDIRMIEVIHPANDEFHKKVARVKGGA